MLPPAPRPVVLRAVARAALLALLLGAVAPAAFAREYASDAKPGIDEKLGETIPLDVTFRDEDDNPVRLGDLITRPTVLTLVYFRCPNICSPLMHEVAATVDKLDMEPGIDFDLITISFDTDETPALAKTAKTNLLAAMKKKLPPESWRFLTGDPLAIMKVADAVGFRFKRNQGEFMHAGTVIFLTKDGMIVRYLGGLKLLPFDMKMAVIDASQGKPRSLMQRVQSLCYSYDPEDKTYVLRIDSIILFVTLTFLGAFLLFLVLKRRPRSEKASDASKPGGATERAV